MSTRANATLIGAFVIGALTLAVLAIITFGGKDFLKKKGQIIMYFSGSVNGLNTGAPVNVRGVQIGTVRKIDIVFNPKTGEIRVPVIADLKPESIEEARKLRLIPNDKDPIKTLVEKLGLRAQLQLQSVLTSQLYIELDYHPDTEIHYYGDGSMLEVPTVPMTLDKLNKALDKVSLEEIAEDFTSSLKALKKLLNSPKVMDTITTVNSSFKEMDNLSRELRQQLDTTGSQIDRTLADIQSLTEEMKQTFKSTNRLIAADSPQVMKLDSALTNISNAADEITRAARTISGLQDSPEMYRLNQALDEITTAARSVRELADTLEREPNAILTGKKTGN